jgi:hypothetical protein
VLRERAGRTVDTEVRLRDVLWRYEVLGVDTRAAGICAVRACTCNYLTWLLSLDTGSRYADSYCIALTKPRDHRSPED